MHKIRFDTSPFKKPVCLFPLPNCVLFPGAPLPLHIFEPRYRRMISDLLAAPDARRFIAVALMTEDDSSTAMTNDAHIASTVGVGEIIQCAALPDGTFNIVLVGRARARVLHDDRSGVYRRAKLRFLATRPRDLLATVHNAIDDVRTALTDLQHFAVLDNDVITHVLSFAADPVTLIDLAAFHLIPSGESEIKQRILAENRLEIRAEILAHQFRKMLHEWRAAQFETDDLSAWPPLHLLN